MGTENLEKFRNWVKDWDKTVKIGVNTVVDDAIRFRNELRDGYNTCFPQRKVKIRKIDLRKPWLDDDLLKNKIKERNTLCAWNQRDSWTVF